MFSPSRYRRSRRGSTRSTLPRLPRSLPPMTITSSPVLIRAGMFSGPPSSQHLRCERDDLHEVAIAELPGHRAEDSGPPRVVLIVDQHRGVLVECDVGAVVAAVGLLRPDDHGGHDLALVDGPLRV